MSPYSLRVLAGIALILVSAATAALPSSAIAADFRVLNAKSRSLPSGATVPPARHRVATKTKAVVPNGFDDIIGALQPLMKL